MYFQIKINYSKSSLFYACMEQNKGGEPIASASTSKSKDSKYKANLHQTNNTYARSRQAY